MKSPEIWLSVVCETLHTDILIPMGEFWPRVEYE